MIELRCPQCNALLLRFNPGEGVEGYCSKCKLEVVARRRMPPYVVRQMPPKPVDTEVHFISALDKP